MSFTQRPGSGRLRQTSRREDRHIVTNARPYEGVWLKDIWDRGAHYVCCPLRSPIDASVWSGAAHEKTGLQRNGTRSSLVTNPDSISAMMTIVLVCGDPVLNASIAPFLYSETPLPQLM
ncbi:uncharacterized protein TNCV_2989051 [Trichonephila clavipes]|nr:uncharacterized protein TNCV_2989051 [Trichonephila clavipes]